jgi:hypothetical protein
MQEFITILGLQYRLQAVVITRPDMAARQRQQMQIVIAQHRDSGIAQAAHKAQHLQRLRPAIDQITDQPKPVTPGLEADALEQPLQLHPAALHITDGVGTHVFSQNRQRKDRRASNGIIRD